MSFLLIIVFIFVAVINMPELIRKKYWNDLTVFSVLLFPSILMSFLLLNNVTIPSPFEGMNFIIKDLLHLNYK